MRKIIIKRSSLTSILSDFWRLNLSLLVSILLTRIFEILYVSSNMVIPNNFMYFELIGFVSDTLFFFSYTLITCLLYLGFSKINVKIAKLFLHSANIFILAAIISLIAFFVERASLLDEELIVSPIAESFFAVKASGVLSFWLFLAYLIPIAFYLVTGYLFNNKFRIKYRTSIFLCIFSLLLFTANLQYAPPTKGEVFVVNKLDYLLKEVASYSINNKKLDYMQGGEKDELTIDLKKEIEFYQKSQGFNFVSEEFPLLHKPANTNSIGHFFNLHNTKPNIVILIIESLSRDFCGAQAPMGNFFTPFIDSLASKSLYWENCLSSSPVSFEVLPTILGSLPYGNIGFGFLPKYPNHLSLIKILKENGYSTNYLHGGPMHISNQGAFIRNQETDFVSYSFPEKYDSAKVGWWGYTDKTLFNYSFELLDSIIHNPYLNIYVTITTHPPYKFNAKENYYNIFDKRVSQQNLSEKQTDDLIKNKEGLSAFMYLDDQLRIFFDTYKKRDDFNNTVFVITGDHQAYMDTKNELTRFQVPLIIYSPLLKESKKFSSLNMHQSITPSLLALLNGNYRLNISPFQHWVGDELDTSVAFTNKYSYPLIDKNKSIDFYIDKNFFIKENDLYEILNSDLDICHVDNDSLFLELNYKRDNYKIINSYCCNNNAIFPDSLSRRDTFSDTLYYNMDLQNYNSESHTIKSQTVKIDGDIKIKIDLSFDIVIPESDLADPVIVIEVFNSKSQKRIYYDVKFMSYLNNTSFKYNEYSKMIISDIIDLKHISLKGENVLKIKLYNEEFLNISIKNYRLLVTY